MKIIEQFVCGKRGDDACEDMIVVTKDFVAVIDGSTSKSKLPPLKDGKSPGRVAAETVAEVVRTMDADIPEASFEREAMRAIRRKYCEYYSEEFIAHASMHPEDRFTCSAIVYSNVRNEIWMVGDCHALIVDSHCYGTAGKHYTNEKPDEAKLAERRSAVAHELLIGGTDVESLRRHDVARDAIIPSLVASMQNQNVEYSVIDGFSCPVFASKIITDIVPGTMEIVLATDGFPQLYPTLQATEAYLQYVLAADPLLIDVEKMTKGWMIGTASFDDRAYIRFSV